MGRKVVSDQELLNSVGKSRRKFLTKVLVGTAFAAPLIASFPMNGLAADSARMVSFGNTTEAQIEACFAPCEGLSGFRRFLCRLAALFRLLTGRC
jgi:hypothetical protein